VATTLGRGKEKEKWGTKDLVVEPLAGARPEKKKGETNSAEGTGTAIANRDASVKNSTGMAANKSFAKGESLWGGPRAREEKGGTFHPSGLLPRAGRGKKVRRDDGPVLGMEEKRKGGAGGQRRPPKRAGSISSRKTRVKQKKKPRKGVASRLERTKNKKKLTQSKGADPPRSRSKPVHQPHERSIEMHNAPRVCSPGGNKGGGKKRRGGQHGNEAIHVFGNGAREKAGKPEGRRLSLQRLNVRDKRKKRRVDKEGRGQHYPRGQRPRPIYRKEGRKLPW